MPHARQASPSRENVSVFDRHLSVRAAITRHKSAPLLKEREQFLLHLEANGTRHSAIRIVSTYLLQVVRLLGLRRLRDVTMDEVDRATDAWSTRDTGHNPTANANAGVKCFAQTARRFLRFHKRSKCPRLSHPFSKFLSSFVEAMSENGLSEATIRGRRYRASNFFQWFSMRHRSLRTMCLTDIDSYTQRIPIETRNPVTIHSELSTLKAFFRHAEGRGWCSESIADSIRLPLLRRELFERQGPVWPDVQRLMEATRGSDPSDLRARPLLLLFAVYGLRRSEAVNLSLKDIDWAAQRFTVHRAKRHVIQQFPLSEQLASSLRTYIEGGAPRHFSPTNLYDSESPDQTPRCAHRFRCRTKPHAEAWNLLQAHRSTLAPARVCQSSSSERAVVY